MDPEASGEAGPAAVAQRVVPPVLGRPSPSSSLPGRLRPLGTSATAAYRADGGDTDRWALRAASVAGVRHRVAGEDGQDAYAWKVSADGHSVAVAVADGVGGVAGSAAAASAAAAAACGALAAALDEGSAVQTQAIEAAVSAADLAARAAGGATTLVVAVVGADGRGRVVRVGDSTALVLSGARWQELWSSGTEDDGPVDTATAALPADRPAMAWADVEVGPGDVVVVLTDGVDNPRRDGPTTVAPALAAGLASLPSPLELAVLVDFSRQGCFDDRTIVGLWCRGASGDGALRHT